MEALAKDVEITVRALEICNRDLDALRREACRRRGICISRKLPSIHPMLETSHTRKQRTENAATILLSFAKTAS